MLQRFVAASAIASILIALGAFAILLIPGIQLRNSYPVTMMWCFMPLIWGLWAMATPKTWAARRLPMWGAILGCIVALVATFVVKIPAQALGAPLSIWARLVGVVVVAALYYVFWMLVRTVYGRLAAAPESAKAASAAGAK